MTTPTLYLSAGFFDCAFGAAILYMAKGMEVCPTSVMFTAMGILHMIFGFLCLLASRNTVRM
jgi:hypothetical protein